MAEVARYSAAKIHCALRMSTPPPVAQCSAPYTYTNPAGYLRRHMHAHGHGWVHTVGGEGGAGNTHTRGPVSPRRCA
jgi:hypothetical protein